MNEGKFIRINLGVMCCKDLDVYSRMVYFTMVYLKGDNLTCRASLNELTKHLGFSRPKIVQSIRELEKFAFIKTIREKMHDGSNATNEYAIIGEGF